MKVESSVISFVSTYRNLVVFVLICIITCHCLNGQTHTNNWYFGGEAGLNFANGTVYSLSDSAMTAPEGCSTISDKEGNLLLYTNGQTIWNKNHEVIENGNFLAGEITNNQSSLIVPKPNSSEVFFVFTTQSSRLQTQTFNLVFTTRLLRFRTIFQME